VTFWQAADCSAKPEAAEPCITLLCPRGGGLSRGGRNCRPRTGLSGRRTWPTARCSDADRSRDPPTRWLGW